MHTLLNDYSDDIAYQVIEKINRILKEKYSIVHTFIVIENLKYNEHK